MSHSRSRYRFLCIPISPFNSVFHHKDKQSRRTTSQTLFAQQKPRSVHRYLCYVCFLDGGEASIEDAFQMGTYRLCYLPPSKPRAKKSRQRKLVILDGQKTYSRKACLIALFALRGTINRSYIYLCKINFRRVCIQSKLH